MMTTASEWLLQMQQLDPARRLVVLQPRATRYIFLHHVMAQHDAFYLRFEGDHLTAQQIAEQWAQAAPEQTAADMPGRWYVLDECDRADDDALSALLLRLLSEYPSGRFLIISRLIPRCILSEPGIASQVQFLPVDENRMLFDYARRSDRRTLLEVYGFGSGRVLLNGARIDDWDGVLPRALFFYLIERGMVTRDDIFATFWPDMAVRDATNVFHVTKRKMIEKLGVDLTIYHAGFYRIAPDIDVHYDVRLFSGLLQDCAVASPERCEELLERALQIYTGHFLRGLDLPWTIRNRSELQELAANALLMLADQKLKTGQNQAALGIYCRARALQPDHEGVTRCIMQCYEQTGQYADALQAFEALVSQSDASAPSPELQAYADHLRQLAGVQS